MILRKYLDSVKVVDSLKVRPRFCESARNDESFLDCHEYYAIIAMTKDRNGDKVDYFVDFAPLQGGGGFTSAIFTKAFETNGFNLPCNKNTRDLTHGG